MKAFVKLDLLKCFVNSRYVPTLAWLGPGGDIFHTNTVEVLDGRLADRCPAFRKGNILISVRMLDVIAVVDPAARDGLDRADFSLVRHLQFRAFLVSFRTFTSQTGFHR